MRRLLLAHAILLAIAAGLGAGSPSAHAQDGSKLVLRGAGATFPAPLYKTWAREYSAKHPGVSIDYQGVGSGEGQRRFLANSVDFGASDSALSDEQIANAKLGATLVPTTAGLVVLAYNLPGVKEPLKLSRSAYVDLLAGRIPKWNDARIQATNLEIKLPATDVVIVARLDSSGTTFALTNHLSAVSPRWRDSGRGVGNLIEWSGNVMLVRGNEGVAARIKLSEGAIGYVEFGIANRAGLAMAHLQNRDGNFVAPSAEVGTGTIAANIKRIPPNLRVFLPDPEGEKAYPIVSFTWLLLPERATDAKRADALRGFVSWALAEGQSMSTSLGYIPLPAALAERARVAVSTSP